METVYESDSQSEPHCRPLPSPRKRNDNKTRKTDTDATEITGYMFEEYKDRCDFGSRRDVISTIIVMPLAVFIINGSCNKDQCTLLQWPQFSRIRWNMFFNAQAIVLYVCWLIVQLALYVFLPGKAVLGQLTPSGKRLVYFCNGFQALVVSVCLFLVAVYFGVPVTVLYDKLFALMTCATVISFLLSAYLYVRATGIPLEERSIFGNTGDPIFDFYLGGELNPRISILDLKFFCELRPGLFGWVLLDLTFVVKYYLEHGSINSPLALVAIFHFMYVADAVYFEESVLTTLDLTTEGFGFMLAFGDLTWVPFLFSLQARFLLEHPQHWSAPWLMGIFLLNCLGYWIFRDSNNEKDIFRTFPKEVTQKRMRSLDTACEKRLLISGWWGLVRHPNYMGDLIQALAWCLLCGFQHMLPWFYMMYLTGTLIHRSGRDDRLCAKKYGSAWQHYCSIVPRKIVPGMY